MRKESKVDTGCIPRSTCLFIILLLSISPPLALLLLLSFSLHTCPAILLSFLFEYSTLFYLSSMDRLFLNLSLPLAPPSPSFLSIRYLHLLSLSSPCSLSRAHSTRLSPSSFPPSLPPSPPPLFLSFPLSPSHPLPPALSPPDSLSFFLARLPSPFPPIFSSPSSPALPVGRSPRRPGERARPRSLARPPARRDGWVRAAEQSTDPSRATRTRASTAQ